MFSIKFMRKINFKSKKGITLYLVILLMMTIILIGGFLLNLIYQTIKISFNISDSIVAFFAADTGAEKILYDLYKGDYQPTEIGCPYPEWQNLDSTGAQYSVCVASTSPNIIIWSTGIYKNSKRKIELVF